MIARPVQSRVVWLARGLSHRMTLMIGSRYGAFFPMYFVGGYPRSGTSWVSEIIADYLGVPRPTEYLLPLAFSCVVHTHAEANWPIRPCVYVVRDGRDCMVSAYFRMAKRLQTGQGVLAGHYKRLFGNHPDLRDVKQHFPVFVEDMLRAPKGTKSNWGNHVSRWIESADKDSQVSLVSYEKLLENGKDYLGECLQELFGEVSHARLQEAFDRHSSSAVQRFGESRAGTSFRKGVAGDWRHWFDRPTAELFHDVCGDTLIQLGYEKDWTWIKECPK